MDGVITRIMEIMVITTTKGMVVDIMITTIKVMVDMTTITTTETKAGAITEIRATEVMEIREMIPMEDMDQVGALGD